ncbi:MAG TPA: glycosyltransferase family 39 protein, partial [Anaerolineales bacterium]|nr:glycosyltransferase family 39 protein [Anaerolineales bacterium]
MWIGAVGVTLGLRIWLLYSAAVPFNSDEAVVGLMARHINQGARPLFFYGQSYMGSLDAFLTAGAFRVLGETVLAIRVVQILLYLAFLFTAWLLARRLLRDEFAAGLAVFVMAVPPVLVVTYTSATLGGYGESLVFGNLILLLGYEVLFGERRRSWWAWGALGLVGGLAFWTLGIAGVYLLPVAVVGLLRFRREMLPYIALAGAAFMIGSAPWWYENLANDWAALDVLIGRSTLSLAQTTPWDRLAGLLLLGLPALLGIRRPWESELEPVWAQGLGLVLFIGLVVFIIEVRRRKWDVFAPGGGLLLGSFTAGFFAIFLATNFGIDSTGRLLLPLYLPVGLGYGALASRLWALRPAAGIALVVMILVFNLACVLRAAVSPAGLTTQFDPITEFDNDHDVQLIGFLEANGLERGFSNYWVTYRLAFLSGEALIYAPRLPYKYDLSYTAND